MTPHVVGGDGEQHRAELGKRGQVLLVQGELLLGDRLPIGDVGLDRVLGDDESPGVHKAHVAGGYVPAQTRPTPLRIVKLPKRAEE
jgi:hypothetical protein